jgi:hypothetical protein
MQAPKNIDRRPIKRMESSTVRAKRRLGRGSLQHSSHRSILRTKKAARATVLQYRIPIVLTTNRVLMGFVGA